MRTRDRKCEDNASRTKHCVERTLQQGFKMELMVSVHYNTCSLRKLLFLCAPPVASYGSKRLIKIIKSSFAE